MLSQMIVENIIKFMMPFFKPQILSTEMQEQVFQPAG